MLRFYIALWAAKLLDFIDKLRGEPRDDRPGLLAFKICPDFLAKVKKPKLVITITGTNGKTTTSNLVNNMLVKSGYKVTFNDWGANLHAGFCLNLMRGVNIFNRCKSDAALLEADENTLAFSMGMIKPNYILVTNICKDSLRRNGHPEFIFDCIRKAFVKLGDSTTAILNANDPISSRVADDTGAKIVYYGMSDIGEKPLENIVKDITVCPYCGADIEYDYRIYRHIGGYRCSECDWKMPEADYLAEKVDLDNRKIAIKEGGELTEYPLISNAVFNASNILSTVAVLRSVGFEKQEIAEFIATQQITKIRADHITYNGVEYHTFATKSQNVSAAATVFEYMAKEPSNKVLVFCLDEVQDRNHPTETLTWLYETDYEPLNSPNIKQIVIGGHMYLNHKLRLLLAGVPEDRIFAVEDDSKVPELVNTDGVDRVYVLYETDYVSKAMSWHKNIVKVAKQRNGEVE